MGPAKQKTQVGLLRRWRGGSARDARVVEVYYYFLFPTGY